MGTVTLNELLGLDLTWWDLHFLYSVVPTPMAPTILRLGILIENLLPTFLTRPRLKEMTILSLLATGSPEMPRGTQLDIFVFLRPLAAHISIQTYFAF